MSDRRRFGQPSQPCSDYQRVFAAHCALRPDNSLPLAKGNGPGLACSGDLHCLLGFSCRLIVAEVLAGSGNNNAGLALGQSGFVIRSSKQVLQWAQDCPLAALADSIC